MLAEKSKEFHEQHKETINEYKKERHRNNKDAAVEQRNMLRSMEKERMNITKQDIKRRKQKLVSKLNVYVVAAIQ